MSLVIIQIYKFRKYVHIIREFNKNIETINKRYYKKLVNFKEISFYFLINIITFILSNIFAL